MPGVYVALSWGCFQGCAQGLCVRGCAWGVSKGVSAGVSAVVSWGVTVDLAYIYTGTNRWHWHANAHPPDSASPSDHLCLRGVVMDSRIGCYMCVKLLHVCCCCCGRRRRRRSRRC